jgi:Bacterial membrane protein YfhO
VKTRWAGLGLVGLVAFHMREALFEGRVYFERDLHLQWYGQVQSFVAAILSGSWPLWDPWVGFGQPLLANANTQTLYPPTWLNLVMLPGTYYTLYLFAHLLAAGLGTFALSRRWGVTPAGSFVASALWITTGALLSLGNAWNHLAGAALVPWILLQAVRVVEDDGVRPILALALGLALAVLAGSPDFVLLAALPMTALAWRSATPLPSRAALARLLGAGALGVLLCAAQLLPSLDLVLDSSRAHLPTGVRSYWSVHPWAALQVLVPLPWNALPWSPERRAEWFESREPYLFSLYVGLPALALAALGLSRTGHRRRFLLVGFGVGALLFAFGRHAPFYEAAITLVPPLRLVRYPAKAMVLFALGVALLAGSGFDVWQTRPSGRRVAALAATGLLLAGLLLLLDGQSAPLAAGFLDAGTTATPRELLRPAFAALSRAAGFALLLAGLAALHARRPHWGTATAVLVAAIGVGDLALAHKDLNATAPRDFYRVRPDVLQALPPQDTQRVLTFDYTMAPGLSETLLHRERPYMVAAPAGPRSLWLGAMGLRLYPVAPVTGGFHVYGSFGRDFLGIQPEPLARLNDFATERMGSPEWERLLARTSVAHLLALHEGALGSLVPWARVHGPFFEDVLVYDVRGALPRCRVVSGVRSGDTPGMLASPAFDPSREVMIAGAEARPAVDGFAGSCLVRSLGYDQVALEARANADAFVTLADAWDPGWHATVDGAAAPLLRADIAFRAVAIPPGRHEVRLAYRPRGLAPGLALSAAGLAAAGALWLRAGRTPRAG